jgi:fatty acid desaturase
VVAHPVRDVPWGFSLKTQANVFFDALLFKKHPTLYRQRIRPRPPWRYYFIVLCTLAALLAALAGEAWLALGLCLPALVAVGIFAAERLHGTAHTPSHIAEMLLTSLAIPYLSVYWRVKGAWHFRVPFV